MQRTLGRWMFVSGRLRACNSCGHLSVTGGGGGPRRRRWSGVGLERVKAGRRRRWRYGQERWQRSPAVGVYRCRPGQVTEARQSVPTVAPRPPVKGAERESTCASSAPDGGRSWRNQLTNQLTAPAGQVRDGDPGEAALTRLSSEQDLPLPGEDALLRGCWITSSCSSVSDREEAWADLASPLLWPGAEARSSDVIWNRARVMTMQEEGRRVSTAPRNAPFVRELRHGLALYARVGAVLQRTCRCSQPNRGCVLGAM